MVPPQIDLKIHIAEWGEDGEEGCFRIYSSFSLIPVHVPSFFFFSEVKRERRVPSPDVIVLSDNEPSSPRMNGLTKIALKETSAEVLMVSLTQQP